MSNELVVEGEDSAPMSEVCSRTQMDAIEELQEEEEEEQEWTPQQAKGKVKSRPPTWTFAEEETAECYSAGEQRGPGYGLVSEVSPDRTFQPEWRGLLHVDLHIIKNAHCKESHAPPSVHPSA